MKQQIRPLFFLSPLFETFGWVVTGIWDVGWLGIENLLWYEVDGDRKVKGRREEFRERGKEGIDISVIKSIFIQ